MLKLKLLNNLTTFFLVVRQTNRVENLRPFSDVSHHRLIVLEVVIQPLPLLVAEINWEAEFK